MALMHSGWYLIQLFGEYPLYCSNECYRASSIGEFNVSLDDPSSFDTVDSKMPWPSVAAVTLEVSYPAYNANYVGPVHHLLTMNFLVMLPSSSAMVLICQCSNKIDIQYNFVANNIRKWPFPLTSSISAFPQDLRNGCLLHANFLTEWAGSCQRMVPGCGSAENDRTLRQMGWLSPLGVEERRSDNQQAKCWWARWWNNFHVHWSPGESLSRHPNAQVFSWATIPEYQQKSPYVTGIVTVMSDCPLTCAGQQ